MQINEEEFVDDIKRFVSENVSLSKISDEELAERIDQIVTDRLMLNVRNWGAQSSARILRPENIILLK